MKNSRTIFVATATALIAGGLGFFAGKSSSDSSTEDNSRASSPDARTVSSRPGTATQTEGLAPQHEPADSQGGKGLSTRPAASADAEKERRTGREKLQRMLEQPGPMSRWQDLMDFAQTATPDQISGALDELINTPNSIDTVVARFFLYSRFGEGDPEAALAAIGGLPQGEIDLAKQSVLGGWAGKDPKAAAEYLLEQAGPDGELDGLNGRLVRNVVAEWSRKSPDEAFQWSLGLKGDGRRTGIETALRIWASRAPETAAEAIDAFPPGKEREDAYRTVAEHWSQSDPQATLEWAELLSDDVSSIVASRAIANYARREPLLAASYIPDLPPGDERDRAMRSTANGWGLSQPGEAADWVLSQPANDAQRKAVRDIVRRWAGEDEGAASEWLNRQESGPAKDSGIAALSSRVADDDPEAAAIWADSIADPTLRANQVRSVVRNWLKQSRDVAVTWLQGANVPDTVKAELLAE